MRQLKITKQITRRESRSLQIHLSEISKIDTFSVGEEAVVAFIAREGNTNVEERRAAREELVVRNMRFVVSVAKKYQGLGLPLTDLINEGHLGMMKAAERFDHTRGFIFISYAVWWIRQAIIDAINKTARSIRIPLNKVAESSKVRAMSLKLTQELERLPTEYEIAEALDMTLETVMACFHNDKRLGELNAPLKQGEEGAATFIDVLVIEEEAKTDSELESESLMIDIERVLCTLTPRDAEIVRLCFGLREFNKKRMRSMTLEEIGEEFELTRERVRQIREKAIAKLKGSPGTEILRGYVA